MAENLRMFGDSDASSLDTIADIQTPENVSFRYEVAGPFRRLPAFMIDVVLRIAIMFLAFLAVVLIGTSSEKFAMTTVSPLVMLVWFALEWFYGAILESQWNGQTIGKRIMRIRVVSVDGRPIDGMQATLRNLLRYLDLMPFVALTAESSALQMPTFAIGLLSTSLSPRFQRIGDLVAGTMVVTESTSTLRRFAMDTDERVLQVARSLPMPLLTSPAESKAILAYCERHQGISPSQRDELLSPLTRIWRQRFSLPEDTDSVVLVHAMYYRLFVSDQVELATTESVS